jgi:hypothetical protein
MGWSFAARIAVGLHFFLFGRGKLFVPQRRAQMRETLVAAHVSFPDFNALFVSTVESVFGFSADPRSADAARLRDARRRDGL